MLRTFGIVATTNAAYYLTFTYMVERRKALAGSLPRRTLRTRRTLTLPADTAFKEVLSGSGGQSASLFK